MESNATSPPRGAILRTPRRYDAQVWLLTLGRERSFRRLILSHAGLRPGQQVLDVGCGTGGLAMEARRQVGSSGNVHGIDASQEMIERARQKAQGAGLAIDFREGAAQELPYPDAQFDVALATLMLHHLPRSSREQCLREIRRVLKPDGRLLVVDFGAPAQASAGPMRHLHRHGHLKADDLAALLGDAGLRVQQRGPLGFRGLQFVLAAAAPQA
ncbi:MAG TPA: methyltransferase domain-containing protein [Albitalea sp.]|nr:methyltransferase domain-containing protein [Albitalea sp.]